MATDYYVVYDTITNRYVKEKLCWEDVQGYIHLQDSGVLAWLPLPEPYHADEEGNA